MKHQLNDLAFIRTRSITLSVMTPSQARALQGMIQSQEVAPTPSSMRLNTAHSPSDRHGRGSRQSQPLSAPAPAPGPLPPPREQFAQGRARGLFCLSSPLWIARPSSQMTKPTARQYRRRLLYTPQQRPVFPQQRRKHFKSLFIIMSITFSLVFFLLSIVTGLPFSFSL